MAKTRLERIAEVPTVATDILMEPEPLPIVQLCENCRGWTSNNGVFGQCLPSGKFLQAPLVTTNRASCKLWESAVRNG